MTEKALLRKLAKLDKFRRTIEIKMENTLDKIQSDREDIVEKIKDIQQAKKAKLIQVGQWYTGNNTFLFTVSTNTWNSTCLYLTSTEKCIHMDERVIENEIFERLVPCAAPSLQKLLKNVESIFHKYIKPTKNQEATNRKNKIN